MASRPELKVDDESGFVKTYHQLEAEKPSGTIRVFDRGDFLSAHGDDARFIAQAQYRTTSVLKSLGRSPGLDSVTMTATVYRSFLREAVFRLGKRVEVLQTNGRGRWEVVKQASPGNLQDIEDDLGGHIDSAPTILAVKVSARANEGRNVGVCFADASVRELGVSEFVDNDIYSNFESLIIQLGVKECLIQVDTSKKDAELSKLRSIADHCSCAISERPSGDFAGRDIEQDLTRLLRGEKTTATLPQTDLKLAMASAAALIKYLGIMSDPSNFGQYQLYQHDLGQYMKLDASALKALNLMPGPKDGSKSMNLYGLLNHCKTPVGSRLLAQWLKQPLMSVEEIGKRHDLVEAFVSDTELRQTLQEEHLRSIPDLYRLAKKFQRKKANLEDVIRAYQVAIRLPGFIGTFEGVMDERHKDVLDVAYTNKLQDFSNYLAKFQEMVETTVDLDAIDNHEYIIKSEFDDTLRVVRKKLDACRYNITKEHQRAGDDLNQDTEKKLLLENHRVHGWCMRLTRNEASVIRNKKQYQEISTQKNGVYFTTTRLAEMRREFDQLSETYNRTQSGLVGEVVNIAGTYCPILEQLAGVLAHLDVIISFAHVSVHAPTPYMRPQMHPRGTGRTLLTEARHPCLETQDDVHFIANDVELVRGSSEFLVITGPNMGGKSTYLRQVGVIALLAQAGCFVPCTTAELAPFDCVLARVGANDSQLRGVSTFMAEMLETAGILKTATRDSLVLIDELGRGTSTYDGFGLAWAISEHLVTHVGAFALFATHFHELAALADSHPQVRNLHVAAHIDSSPSSRTSSSADVTLLYKVLPGVSDRSFGIHVAELVRFPQKVVRMARRKAAELEDFSSSASGTGEAATPSASPADVATGSRLLKAALREWTAQVEREALKPEEQVERLRVLISQDEELMKNPFFQGVRAL